MFKLSIVTAIVVVFTFHTSCFNAGGQQVSANYPSLADQRKALASKPNAVPVRVLDSAQIIQDLQYLSSAELAGRRPGTEGHVLARQRILERLRQAGVDSFKQSLVQEFENDGKNVVGWVKGTVHPDKFIVLTAHYDHLGKTARGIYHGADDNASGVACLMALAKYFKLHPQPYSIIFAALDMEEMGLRGAYAFVNAFPQLTKGEMVLNINMDMIARSDNNEIFAVGIHHKPSLKYLVDEVQSATNVKLLMGHDTGNPQNDWTHQSDHLAFHKKGVPFIYIGVEDHPDYHKPSDTHDKVDYARYIENCNMIQMMIKKFR